MLQVAYVSTDHDYVSHPKVLYFEVRRVIGRAIAVRSLLAYFIEESPGSMDRLPGNTWADENPTDSATENRPPPRKRW
jgi:hypothetical protein